MFSKLETLIHTPTKRLQAWLRRWESQIANALLHGQYRITPEGVILFDDHVLKGNYFHRIPTREKDFTFDHNLVVDQGLMKALGVMFWTDTKPAGWYLTMHSGSTAPANTLTAANYASTMSEITSTTEGFSNVTRPAFVPVAPAANVIANTGNYATFNCVCTTSINATGAALLSDNTRGGTSGTIYSSGMFGTTRQIFNGEPFQLGYQASLTD